MALAAATVAAPSASADDRVTGENFASAAEFHDSWMAYGQYESINALAAQQVLNSTECFSHHFCPTEPVPRWTAAVWLSRILGQGTVPPAAETRFTDADAGSWWAVHVEHLAELGVTDGCAAGLFCLHDPVTRGQAASLLNRAVDLGSDPGSQTDDPTPQTALSDIADSVHEQNINAIVDVGVAEQCRSNRFCPSEPVTRAEMAVFVNHLQNLLPSTLLDPSTVYYSGVRVSIADEALRRIVERVLGKSEGEAITAGEARRVTRLNAGHSGIRDITGLEHFTSLAHSEFRRQQHQRPDTAERVGEAQESAPRQQPHPRFHSAVIHE